MSESSGPKVQTRQTRSKRKVTFEEPVANARPRQRREAVALVDDSASDEPVMREEALVPCEVTMPCEITMPCDATVPCEAATPEVTMQEEPEDTALPDDVPDDVEPVEQAAPDEPVLPEVQPCEDDNRQGLEQSPTTLAKAARAEATTDQASPGPSVTPHAKSPSTPAALPEDASPGESTAQTAQTARDEPDGGGDESTGAVGDQGDLRWSLMQSKLDTALHTLASLSASVSSMTGSMGEISSSLSILTTHVLARGPPPTAEAPQPSAEQLLRAQASREAALRVRALNASRPAASHGTGAPSCAGVQPFSVLPPPNVNHFSNPGPHGPGPPTPAMSAPTTPIPRALSAPPHQAQGAPGMTQVQADRMRTSLEAAKARRGEGAGDGGNAPVAAPHYPAVNVSRDAALAFKSPRFVADRPNSVRYPL